MADIDMKQVPLRSFVGMMNELTEVAKNYDKVQHRGKPKDDAHLNKHAMHLIRLYLMCLDILEKEEIITHREADHNLLMSIRNGVYQKEDHTFRSEFFDMIADFEKRLAFAKENTGLPPQPDVKRIEAFMMAVNERVVRDAL